MKMRRTMLIPLALGLMVSACSTTNNSSSQGVGVTGSAVVQAAWQKRSQNHQKLFALKQTLAKNDEQILALQTALDEKDKTISSLQQLASNAESLLKLTDEKRSRDTLESQYAELKVENDHLVNQIHTVESDNALLEQDILDASQKSNATATVNTQGAGPLLSLNDSFQTLDSKYYALSQEYKALQVEQMDLQGKYAKLDQKNQEAQLSLSSLQTENDRLAQIITQLKARNASLLEKNTLQQDSIDGMQKQAAIPLDDSALKALDTDQLRQNIQQLKGVVAAQKNLISDYQSDVAALQSSMQAGEVDDEGVVALNGRLSELSNINASVEQQLAENQTALLASVQKQQDLQQALDDAKRQQADLQAQLDGIKAQANGDVSQRLALQSQMNKLIPFQAAVRSLQAQMDSELTKVRWQVPKQMALHNNFEIIITAKVNKPVAGQVYVAELITDSAIQMVSASEAEAVLDNGELQWRWRVNGLNERPNAQLNVFVSQQMNYQGQRIMRQVYRDSDTVALTNDNVWDKYGYWGIAILAGLAGGFLVGRVNRRQTNS